MRLARVAGLRARLRCRFRELSGLGGVGLLRGHGRFSFEKIGLRLPTRHELPPARAGIKWIPSEFSALSQFFMSLK